MYALGRRPRTMQDALKYVKSYIANSKVIGVGKHVTFEQKAVSVAPEESYKALTDSLFRNVESLLKTHLDPRSRSPSPAMAHREPYLRPQEKPKEKDSVPYRTHSEFERGRPRQRFERSDREPYRRSPDQTRYQRPYSPLPNRPYSPRSSSPGQYSPSPQRNNFRPQNDRYWDRRENRYRSPSWERNNEPYRGYREPTRGEPYRGYKGSPRYDPNQGYRQPPRYYQERGTGQTRRDYKVRSTSPLPSEEKSETLNLDGLVAPATRN